MRHSRLPLSLCLLGAAALCAPSPAIAASESLPAVRGAEGASGAILQELRSFGTLGTVLHVGAHPDDENTQLITYLSRGRGYRAAYLSLTRGDGGQNELGRDFDEKLGVARTQELLAARKYDGGRQFFTRAIDFGYSKSPEETLRFWDRDQVLADVVRVYRQFRPDVIVTRFPIPPGSGGHGHHTASAMLAVEAFKLSGDPSAYPEQLTEGLTVWQPKRVLWNSWSGGRGNTGGLNGPTVTLDIGGTDPVTGESFGTIANRSRGMHKTQGLGGFSDRTATGPNPQTLMLLSGEAADQDFMDGIDLTWNRIPGGAEIGQLARAAITLFKNADPAASVPALLDLRLKLSALPTDPLVADKRAQLDRILQACLGLQVATTVAQAEIVPGEPLRLQYQLGVQAKNVAVRHVESRSPALQLSAIRSAGLTAGQMLTGELIGVLPLDTPLTQPYWLRADGAAGISRVDDPALISRAENPPEVPLEHIFTVGGQTLIVADEAVQPNGANAQARRLAVIPPVSLQFDSEIYLIAPGTSKTVTVAVTAARTNAQGTLHLNALPGWQAVPAIRNFQLANVGDRVSVTFQVTAATQPGAGRLTAVAEIDGRQYSNQRVEIRYDHLPLQLLQPPARARVAGFNLAVRARTVGYLPGAGDAVAECLTQMGCTVRLLTGGELTPEKLAGLDAVVIGVRAFNERTDLAANFPGLLAYVDQGGTVIAQYNRPNGLLATVLGPYPLSIQGPAPALRVTDETSPYSILAPDHPVLNTPNQITAADFAGWVQERGAYFPATWDEAHYQSVLAFNDPGEAPLKSGILVAPHGKGFYIYTGVAFFRQLPAGVPGAYRLFANLLSLGK